MVTTIIIDPALVSQKQLMKKNMAKMEETLLTLERMTSRPFRHIVEVLDELTPEELEEIQALDPFGYVKEMKGRT